MSWLDLDLQFMIRIGTSWEEENFHLEAPKQDNLGEPFTFWSLNLNYNLES